MTDYKSINAWVTKKVDEAKELCVSRGTPNWPCVICDKDGDSYWKIKKRSNMIIHLCERHLRLKLRDTYNNGSVCYCPEEGCKKFYNRQINQDHHIKEKHLMVNLFRCSFCPKEFGQDDQRLEHEVRHNKEKKIQCSLCSRKYVKHSNLSRHLKDAHNVTCEHRLVQVNFSIVKFFAAFFWTVTH